MQPFKLIAIWCPAPLVAFLLDLLTIRTIVFAVVCYIVARASANIGEWLAVMAKRQNHGHENGRRVAVFLNLCCMVVLALSIVTIIAAQVNHFTHWVA